MCTELPIRQAPILHFNSGLVSLKNISFLFPLYKCFKKELLNLSYVSVHPGYTTWSIAFLPCPFNNPLNKQIWIEGIVNAVVKDGYKYIGQWSSSAGSGSFRGDNYSA